jgi:hypothetical protein
MIDALAQEPDRTGLTDEQTSRLMIQSIAEYRSENQQRKFPRFPTPATVSGRLGIHGFEGSLVLEDASAPKGRTRAGDEAIGINIVDFSETGVQLQYRSVDLMRLQESRLQLQLLGHGIPVTLKWYEHTGSISRGGFSFDSDIDSNQYLARIISILNTELVDFTMNAYKEFQGISKAQFGVFIYLSIYYGLRLRLMEAIATIKGSQCLDTDCPCTGKSPQKSPLFPYSSTYNVDQALKYRSDNQARKKLYTYIRPFFEFGCGIIGTHNKILFIKEDIWTTILNSIFIAEEDCIRSSKILPSLSFLYQSFLHLKKLMPGPFAEEEFDNQFRYYSGVILRIDWLRQPV